MKLTDQQQAIVRHERGPALVFAVAGAGKTTCMVHRIHRLIERNIVSPQRILATSFNNAAVADVVAQLERIGVSAGRGGVDCRTLHSLGYRVIRAAVQRGRLEKSWFRRVDGEEGAGRLVGQTLTRMAIEDGVDTSALSVDREDLKNQIAIWKGNLMYPDLAAADLPEAALSIARRAEHENPDYLRAYRLYEQIRTAQQVITFDDMLMLGWELLMRYPDILASAQESYQSVIVDEFQDVNFSQYQILDLLVRPHGNYMAIGDDDQCIYEWRGATPSFILNFEKTYDARVYTISDNFRSRAQQVLLGNAVIAMNRQRYPKFLGLTRGFSGSTAIIREENDWQIARDIADRIDGAISRGQSPADMVVLIRLYSQTAFVETAFMERDIYYEVVGNVPFYKRSEVVPLFQYLSFAFVEAGIREQGYPEDPARVTKYLDMFQNIANRPRRYLSRDVVGAAVMMSRNTRRSVIEVLLSQREGLPRRVQKEVDGLAETIRLLILRLKRTAHKTLQWLIDTIDYEDYLLNISGQYEIGLTRIQTVQALVEFARLKKLRCQAFLDLIRELSLNPVANPQQRPPLRIMTIYKAKGLEWDTVFVPGAYEGLAPCIVSDPDSAGVVPPRLVEAERRLFYVAVTRAREQLFLYYAADKGLTPFLEDVDAGALLLTINRFGKWLAETTRFSETDAVYFCEQLSGLRLERYFRYWSDFLDQHRDRFRSIVENLETHIASAADAEREYQQALKAYQEKNARAREKQRQLEQRIRQAEVIVRKFKSAYYRMQVGQALRFEMFDDGSVIVLAEKGMVGVVDFEEMPRFDRAAVHWPASSAIVKRILSDVLVMVQFEKIQLDRQHLAGKVGGWRAPSPLADRHRKWLSPALWDGLGFLQKIL